MNFRGIPFFKLQNNPETRVNGKKYNVGYSFAAEVHFFVSNLNQNHLAGLNIQIMYRHTLFSMSLTYLFSHKHHCDTIIIYMPLPKLVRKK